jgi:hypothetical protein
LYVVITSGFNFVSYLRHLVASPNFESENTLLFSLFSGNLPRMQAAEREGDLPRVRLLLWRPAFRRGAQFQPRHDRPRIHNSE